MTNEAIKEKSALGVFISYYRRHIGLFILDMVCALGMALVDLAFPLATKYSLENLLPDDLYVIFFSLMGAILALYIIRGCLQYIVTYWGHTMGIRIEADIRRDLFAHLQRLSFSFYDKNRTGNLMSRVTGDLFEITELAHHGPEDVFISSVTLIGALIIILRIEWRLAVIVFAVVPFLVMFTIIQRKKMMKASKRVQERLATINGSLESAISGMKTAKAFSNEEVEKRKFAVSNDSFKLSKTERYKAMAFYQSSLEFFLSVMTVLSITVGGFFIMKGELNYIDLITFNLYIAAFMSPIKRLASFVEQYLVGMAGFSRFVEIMKVDPEITDKAGAMDMEKAKGEIELKDVSFSYGGNRNVLEHVSIKISAGEMLAVVGPSGGGKTTLCSLIPRFYDVESGAVLVDGYDVRAVTQSSLRSNIGIVSQDVFLFADTVIENIRYGREDASFEEVAEAARRAEIYDDITQMPQGFDTYVGERGMLLSGGQKQRVSIARIFLKNPPILILDEATSALDSITESRIQNSFDELSKGRTTIVIAHRLSTVRNADKIIVIDDEGISEQGTHEELLSSGGKYEELYRAQMCGYTDLDERNSI